MTRLSSSNQGIGRSSVRSTINDAWNMRRAWWFTATARTRARFARTFFGSFWLGLSNLLSIAALAVVYGTVFKVQDFNTYVVYLGIGLVVWNGISAAIGSAPNLFEHNHSHVHNTNLNPIFFVLEEWAFQVQTFLQSFVLVVLALSWFQYNLLFNLLVYGWFPLLNLFLFFSIISKNSFNSFIQWRWGDAMFFVESKLFFSSIIGFINCFLHAFGDFISIHNGFPIQVPCCSTNCLCE